MKKMTIDESGRALLDEVLANARKDRVLLKRGGRPVALVINVEDKDEEQLELENDPRFWRSIEKARGEPTVPYSKVKERLQADERAAPSAGKPKTKNSKTRKKD
jgi:hypothetical protein